MLTSVSERESEFARMARAGEARGLNEALLLMRERWGVAIKRETAAQIWAQSTAAGRLAEIEAMVRELRDEQRRLGDALGLPPARSAR